MKRIGMALLMVALALCWSASSAIGQTCPAVGLADGGCPPPLELSGVTLTDAGTCTDYNPMKNVYWGDLHNHSYFSLDAYGFGNRRTPYDAYQFALGVCGVVQGNATQIDRPLDFVVVSDHSEYLGATDECFDLIGPKTTDYSSSYCQGMRTLGALPPPQNFVSLYYGGVGCAEGNDSCVASKEPVIESTDPTVYQAAQQSVWQREVTTADSVYNAHQCVLTSLPAFEWTASPNGDTLHHIVVFANSTVPVAPLDYLNYDTEEKLLTGLQTQCTGLDAGCDVITIQHNSNLSGGQAWFMGADGGTPMEELRVQFERLAEMHQSKGNSECVYDPTDTFGYNEPLCNFEYRTNNVTEADGGTTGQDASTVAPGYVRPGLGVGLADWATNGRNAWQLGFVGATDNHQSTPGNVRESTWNGAIAAEDDTPTKRLTGDNHLWGTVNPGGITGVWAEQNLRPNVFAALQRRETFATSGPRIPVRFYQTWDQTTDFCADPDFPAQIEASIATNGGSIMGGNMPAAPPGVTGSPRFVVFAMHDALCEPTYGTAADLSEMQLIKGSYDPSTKSVTVPKPLSRFVISPPRAHETGASFCHTFTDSAYDATKATYYYPRVLQQPTERWSYYDCEKAPAPCTAKQMEKIQERAWGSPIWYLP